MMFRHLSSPGPTARRLALLLPLLLAAPLAQAACSELDAEGFEGFVDDAMAAIDDDDLVRHGAVFRAMQEQLPCLDERVPAGPWSEFLVGFAVVEYAMGREWAEALDVAIRIHPTVGRDYGPVEIRSYASDVVLEPADAPELPTDATFYVDGQPVTREPALGKLHIVQREKDGVWTTFLLLGEPWPAEWKAKVVEQPEEPTGGSQLRASLYAQGGLLAGSQATQANIPSVSDTSATGLLVGIGTFGDYGPGGPFGMFWDLAGPMGFTRGFGNGIGIEGYVGPSLLVGPMAVNLGAGLTSVGVEDAEGPRTVLIPQPHLGARVVDGLTDGLDLDVGGGLGWIFSGWHARLHAGVRGGGTVGWNAGLSFSGNAALLEQEGSPNNLASALAWRVGLRGGVSFGN